MERLVRFPAKTILAVLGLIVAVWALLHVIVVARSVIVYMFIALFLALAINPSSSCSCDAGSAAEARRQGSPA